MKYTLYCNDGTPIDVSQEVWQFNRDRERAERQRLETVTAASLILNFLLLVYYVGA